MPSIDDSSLMIDFNSDSKMLRNLIVCAKMLDVFFGKHLGPITELILSNSNICACTVIFQRPDVGQEQSGND